MKFDNVSTPNKTIMNTCHVMLVFLLLFGVLSSTSLSATLPAELPLTMKRFFGKLPQRGQARAVTSAGSRYDTCRLPEWLPSMQIMNTTVYLGAGAFTGTQACGMCIAYRGHGEDEIKYGIVGGWCPTCRSADLGLPASDGRFSVKGNVVWAPVQCNTQCFGLIYELVFNARERRLWLKVLQTRVPFVSVHIMLNGKAVPMELQKNSFWEVPPEMLEGPIPPPNLRLNMKSALGDRLDDDVISLEWRMFGDGRLYAMRSLQLPVSKHYASMVAEEPHCSALGSVLQGGGSDGEAATAADSAETPADVHEADPSTSQSVPPAASGPTDQCHSCSGFSPVCSAGGEVYYNLCHAVECMGVDPSAVSAAHCRPQPQPQPSSDAAQDEVCSRCSADGLQPVCSESGLEVYVNECFAVECRGVDAATVSADFCKGAATGEESGQAPAGAAEVEEESSKCMTCSEQGLDQVCSKSGQEIYVNRCFAEECLGISSTSISSEFCIDSEPSSAQPSGIQTDQCADCADEGLNQVCSRSVGEVYANRCIAVKCFGLDPNSVSPAFCQQPTAETIAPEHEQGEDRCSSCMGQGINQVCSRSGSEVYANLCYAVHCMGLNPSSVSAEFCDGGGSARAAKPGAAAPQQLCSECAQEGYHPVCSASGKTFANDCFAVACHDVDPNDITPGPCP
uniref:Kazal-like domain-containing protein n=1 Tax=Tetraselmis sp. GSL018 TaxID=582737 RepID=A0A061QMR9_9CHLO